MVDFELLYRFIIEKLNMVVLIVNVVRVVRFFEKEIYDNNILFSLF